MRAGPFRNEVRAENGTSRVASWSWCCSWRPIAPNIHKILLPHLVLSTVQGYVYQQWEEMPGGVRRLPCLFLLLLSTLMFTSIFQNDIEGMCRFRWTLGSWNFMSGTKTLPKQQQSLLNYLLFIHHAPSFLLLICFSSVLHIKNEWLWLDFRGVPAFLLLAGVIQEQCTAETRIAIPLPDGIQLRDAITIINCLGCTLLVYDVSRDPQLSYILLFN